MECFPRKANKLIFRLLTRHKQTMKSERNVAIKGSLPCPKRGNTTLLFLIYKKNAVAINVMTRSIYLFILFRIKQSRSLFTAIKIPEANVASQEERPEAKKFNEFKTEPGFKYKKVSPQIETILLFIDQYKSGKIIHKTIKRRLIHQVILYDLKL